MSYDVTVDVTKLRNVNGEEGVDEPYVLIGSLVLDATSLVVSTSFADVASPVDASKIKFVWVGKGRGNVNPAEVPEGAEADIPPSAGRVTARLKPLILKNPTSSQVSVVPGMVAVFVGLYEEDMNTNELIKDLQTKASPVVEKHVREFIEAKPYSFWAGPDENNTAITFGHPGYRSALNARLRSEIQSDLQPTLRKELRALAKSVGLKQEPWSVFDTDDDLGSAFWVLPSDETALAGFSGTAPLPAREISNYTVSDPWNYSVWGTYAWTGNPIGRLLIEHKVIGEHAYGRASTRTLETEEGACGHKGAQVRIERRTVDETFSITVPSSKDEFTYDLLVNGVVVTANGFPPGQKSGVFVVPGPSVWTDLEPGSDVWPTRTVSVNQEPACAFHIDDAETDPAGGFVLHVHRLSSDELDARSAMTLPIELRALAGGQVKSVEQNFVTFQSMRLNNPVLECLWSQATMLYERPALEFGARPPWMDPPFHDPYDPEATSGGWIYQLRDVDLRDRVLVAATERWAIASPEDRVDVAEGLQLLGLSNHDVLRLRDAANLQLSVNVPH